ncbi:MAG TPA: TetR/AcrR family transcriptional regulator [Gemmatimonadaceae bacterium]|nr:TetR/AcrR family transcriptional regulator [Gemmatimonadaceae bacterium]
MTPRPYTHGERQRTVDAGRDRILQAALELLQIDNIAAFSLDAVARRAGMTRMTVYNQFGSKAGLLEELFDLIVERGAFRDMPTVFTQSDAMAALEGFVAILGRFYTENRPVLTRMRTVAGTDPDFDEAMRQRHERRRHAIGALLERLRKQHKPVIAAAELLNTVDVLLGFNTFDALAGPARTPSDVVPLVQQMLRGVLGVEDKRKRSPRKTGRKPRRTR